MKLAILSLLSLLPAVAFGSSAVVVFNDTQHKPCAIIKFNEIQLTAFYVADGKSKSLSADPLTNSSAIFTPHEITVCSKTVQTFTFDFKYKDEKNKDHGTITMTAKVNGTSPPPSSSAAPPRPASSTAPPPSSSSAPPVPSSSVVPSASSSPPVPSPSVSPNASDASPDAPSLRRRSARASTNASEWYLAALSVQYVHVDSNGNQTVSRHTYKFDHDNSTFKAKGYGLKCPGTSEFRTSKKTNNTVNAMFTDLAMQPFNVKPDQNSIQPNPDTNKYGLCDAAIRDHTLAIAVAAAVGGMIVIAVGVYLFYGKKKKGYAQI